MGVGDMALLADQRQSPGERTAPRMFHHIAELFAARRLAENAMVETLAFRPGPVEQLGRPVDGDAFFIAGDEKRDRALERSFAGDVAQRRGDRSGDAALHVARAATPDHAVGDHARERIEAPFGDIARRHDIRMTRENYIW